jgi:hypothetical protein
MFLKGERWAGGASVIYLLMREGTRSKEKVMGMDG